METEKYKLKYPIHVRARYLHLYRNRDCPCIIYFEYKSEPISVFIHKKVTLLNEKYPDIFCYKVGWESHKKYYQKVIPSDLFDVTLWRRGKKVMVCKNPLLDNLESLFCNAQTQINGLDKNVYAFILYHEFEKQKRIEITYKNQSEKRKAMKKKCCYKTSKTQFKNKTINSNEMIKTHENRTDETKLNIPLNVDINRKPKYNISIINKYNIPPLNNFINSQASYINKNNVKIISMDELSTAESLLLLSQGSNQSKT